RADRVGDGLELRLRANELRHGLLEIAGHRVERVGEHADLVVRVDVAAMREIARGDAAGRLGELEDGPDEEAGGAERDRRGDEERQKRHRGAAAEETAGGAV